MKGQCNSIETVQPPLIVHIIYSLGTGGLENGLVNIINRCPTERYCHAIICLTRAETFANRLIAPNVKIIELHKKPGHDLFMYWRLWRELRRLRPAIVHTRNLAALESQLLGVFMPGCKRVHGEHGRDVNDLDGSNRKYQWLRRILRPFIHRFIAVSDDLADWLVQSVHIPSRQVEQIYNGVDHGRFTIHPSLSSAKQWPEGVPDGFFPVGECQVVGTVGRLATVKDQQLILHSLRGIFARQPERSAVLRCIIVGEGPEREPLERHIAKWGLSDCVWLTGDREDIPMLLACMDIFVLPSLGEGISNTVLEAMATGLPVIATDVGGNPELIQDGVNGKLIPVGDASALAQAIVALLDDTSLRERMGRKAVQRVRNDFDWERTVADYLRVYDDVLRRPAIQPQTGGA